MSSFWGPPPFDRFAEEAATIGKAPKLETFDRKVLLSLFNLDFEASGWDKFSLDIFEFVYTEMYVALCLLRKKDELKKLIEMFTQSEEFFVKKGMNESADLIHNNILMPLRQSLNSGTPIKKEEFIAFIAATYLSGTPAIGGKGNLRVISEIYDEVIGPNCPVILPNQIPNHDTSDGNDISLSLVGIPIVDTSRLSWDKLLEFRKDSDSREKLRNLRLFLHQNYQGKSQEYIQDDLMKRLDQFEQTCKDWDFETRHSIMSLLINSKNIKAAFSATAGAILLGQPVVASGIALSGVSFELGKICLEITKRNHTFSKLLRDNDIAYLIDAKKKFK